MGIFGKIKDILFEEEEIEVETKPKEEKKVEVIPEKEPEINEEIKPVQSSTISSYQETNNEINSIKKDDYVSERDLYKNDNSSPFLDFDEEEFSSLLVRPKNKSTNVIEYERKRKTEKRTDYGRYERTEVKETVEKKKFKPSPIISPVYGILNEDYHIEDIKNKNDEIENLDIDKVRKKAFEPKEVKEEPKVDYYEEETVTVKYEEPEEKLKKDKTIDDLLEDTSDEIISVKEEPETKNSIKYDELEDDDEIISVQDDTQEFAKNDVIEENNLTDNDANENDLFDLIDSMYENREDGE